MKHPPTIYPTQYTVNCVPETVDGYYHFTIVVQYRGHDRWAIYRNTSQGGPLWSRQGCWDYGESSEDRDDEQWMADHRFSQEEALSIAAELAPHLTIRGSNGEWTVDRIMEEQFR